MLLSLLQQNLGGSAAPLLYAVIGPDAGWTDPSAAEIIAGTLAGGGAATWDGSTTAPVVTTAPFDWPTDATGLTSGTAYRIAFVWSDGTTDSNVVVSASFSTTSSGTTYNVDQAEAATAAEVLAALVAWQVAIAEAAAATEAQTASMVRVGAMAEAASAADSITVTVIYGASLTEAATAADVQTSVATLLAAIAEAAAAAESTTTGGVTTADLTESVTAADALATLAALAAALTEPATAADLLAAAMVANAAVAEALAAADLLAAGPQLSGAVDETATAADALAVTASLVAQIAEAATPDDAATVAQQLLALITESATAADLVDGDMPTAYSVSLAEVAAALDVITAAMVGDITSRYIVRPRAISRVVAGTTETRIVHPSGGTRNVRPS